MSREDTMGKAAHVFLCLILVLPISIAQPVLPPPKIVVDNLSHYPMEYTHHITYTDGRFVNGELQTIEELERVEFLVEDGVASVRTSYSIVTPGPMLGSWNTIEAWKILPSGVPEYDVYWTIDDEGFWVADLDPARFPWIDETKQCDWRSTGI